MRTWKLLGVAMATMFCACVAARESASASNLESPLSCNDAQETRRLIEATFCKSSYGVGHSSSGQITTRKLPKFEFRERLIFEQVVRAVAFEVAATTVAAAQLSSPKLMQAVVGVDRMLGSRPAAQSLKMQMAKKPQGVEIEKGS